MKMRIFSVRDWLPEYEAVKAKVYHPYIEQGSDWVFHGVCTNADGTPFNFTNWTGRSQLRDATNSSIVIASLTVAPIEPIATSGILKVTLLAAASSAIPLPGRTFQELRGFVWDVEIENSVSGQIVRLFNGVAKMSPEATKPTAP